ncbi:MAG: acyl-CoA transferase/carnitine dehydratase [candidate division NC10 bacterium CSP1-5]|nr:MAG: acyl-CoA transferase/carnitine dehydratase [candidate division NC10 bacterium CSP1-5]
MTARMPLEGVVVLDATQVMAGPFCTLLLADMGADVIKVEKLQGGDDSRSFGPPFIAEESAAFLAINRNKRSVTLNLKSEEGRDVFRRLARRSEILVENFRPGTMESLGLHYEAIQGINPTIIYCSISGFGQTGPYRSLGGFDLVAQGMSGLISVTGHPGDLPTKVGVPISDLNAGMYAAYGILSAYIHRLKTGEGQYVDTSLLEGAVAYTFWESSIYFATGEIPLPMGSAHRLNAPYQVFDTQDGALSVGAANQSTWERLCKVLGRQDLAEDPRFVSSADRVRHCRQLAATLQPVFRQRTTAAWLALLKEAGVPAGPIYNMAQVYEDPHVRAREMLVELDHPVAGTIKNIGIPVKLSRSPGRIRRPAPLLGQHTEEILHWLGIDQAQIGKLRAAGAIA